MPHIDDNLSRTTDHAINVLYVLVTIFNGAGCTEASKVLGFLSLPNDTTMDSSTFATIEERIAPVIKELNDEIVHENLVKEVKANNW